MDQTRISLRPFSLSDADDFLSWANDERVTQFLRWGPVKSRDEALKYLQEVVITHPWRQSICLDNRSIGYVSVRPESGHDRHRAHISYAVGADYWGQGIVTAALRVAIPLAFKEFPYLVRLEALVEEPNNGSQRVLEKVGFQKEGFLRKYGVNKGEIRDLIIYSLLSTDEMV
ncbi:hypothetical protein NMG60_11029942 [Bertholletia excelsa]